MTSLFAANGLLKTIEGKPTTLITGGGEWSPEEIKATTRRSISPVGGGAQGGMLTGMGS